MFFCAKINFNLHCQINGNRMWVVRLTNSLKYKNCTLQWFTNIGAKIHMWVSCMNKTGFIKDYNNFSGHCDVFCGL